MKAFLVDCEGEYGAQLYFAATRGQAKAAAANDEDTDITSVVSCRRKPEYDQYAPGPVPISVLMDDGWWFECSGCGRKVYGDGEEHWHGNDPCEAPALVIGHSVWCCERCKREAEERERKYAQELQAKTERARAELLAKFPDATIEHVNPYDPPYLQFRIPVPTREPIGWRAGESSVWVLPADLPAWNRYEDMRCSHLAVWENDGGSLSPAGR